MTHRSVLAGRAGEQAALQDLLSSVGAGLSASLVLRGEAGVGKTALLQNLRSAAPHIDFALLSGVQAEAGLGFAGLYRLLVPYLARIDTLPAAQQLALSTALGLRDGPAASPFLIGLGVLTMLAEAAQDRPLVCLIDDAQWLDPESLEVLAFVARRIYAEGLGVVFAVREPPRIAALEGIPVLPVPGLPPEQAADLLLTLASGRLDRQVAQRLAVQSAGNPLVLTEVAREVSAGRMAPASLLNEPVPVGARLEDHFQVAVRRLPTDCQALLLLSAADAGTDPTVVWRAAAMENLGPEAALPAEAARLVELSPEFGFRHPLIRAAVYACAEPAERRRAHQLLARATDPSDPDLRAWHRAAATTAPDENVAAELERSSQKARSRGGFLAEADLLARSAELSPDTAPAAARTLRAAAAAINGGAPLRAIALLTAGDRYLADPLDRAHAERLLAQAGFLSGRPLGDAAATLLAVATAFAAVDTELARRTLLDAVELAFVTGHFMTGVTSAELARAALTLPTGPDGDPDLETLLLTGLATLAGIGYTEAAPLLRRAVAAMSRPDAVAGDVPSWFLCGAFAAHALWDDRARRAWLQRCEGRARVTGTLHMLQVALTCLSITEAQTGQLDAAQTLTDDSRQLARSIGRSEAEMAVMANPELLAWRGDDEGVRRAADTAAAAAEHLQAADLNRPGYAALMVMHLGRGRYPEAFEAAGRMRAEDTVHFDNEALPNLVEAGVRSDHRDAAEAALRELEDRATASGTSWALGLLARSRALLAEDDPEPFYRSSIDHLGATTAVSDLARAHLLYGEWLRRQKRRLDARAQLRRAWQLFTDLGAPAFAERARIELAATGMQVDRPATGRAGGELTSQEAQIARLAADGATNQVIATALFISSHTVSYHLTKAFRKLGISSRRQLRGVLRP